MGSLKSNPFSHIKDISFRIYTEDEIAKISVVDINVENGLNSLGHCIDGGIYDLRMGPFHTSSHDLCKTCGQGYHSCSGHYGSIDLPLPVYNPFFISLLQGLIPNICHACFRYQADPYRSIQFTYECQIFMDGYPMEALEVNSLVRKFMKDPPEAIESFVENDDKSDPKSNSQMIIALERFLKRFLKRLRKEVLPSKDATCNTQAIYSQLVKNFHAGIKLKSHCKFCGIRLLKLRIVNSQICISNNTKSTDDKEEEFSELVVSQSQPYMTPKQALHIVTKCFQNDGILLLRLYPFLMNIEFENPADVFFIKKLLVLPPKHRPNNMQNGVIVESEKGAIYKNVIRLSKCLQFMVQHIEKEIPELPQSLKYLLEQSQGQTILQKIHNIWHQLQGTVDNIFDSRINPSMNVASKGIRQVVEKKFGLVRRNLMGKRVDFSARSVAAPDAMLAVDEVGIPLDFALKLTYPVPVTHWNVAKLRKLVQNGPDTFPGALMVQDEEGRKVLLKGKSRTKRNAVANSLMTPAESCVGLVNATKIVYRHLQNGDYVLINRQPTLHKPSIQAHRVVVMPQDRVIRLPYSSCKAYNADFDGDELNLHFPQNELARSEAHHLITSRNQYLTPKDGSPLGGLIQDCVVSGVMLTVRGKFLSLEDYQQLVYVALGPIPGKIRLLKPAILKPRQLWSGKQVISTLLLNLVPQGKALPSFVFKTAVKVNLWQTAETRKWACKLPNLRSNLAMTESEFVMREGELLCGVIDKCAIGSTSYGLVHNCFEVYGGMVASQLLTALGRLCVWYLQWTGHTISLKDFVTSQRVSAKRKADISDLIQTTEEKVTAKLNLPPETNLSAHLKSLHSCNNTKEMEVVDSAYTSVLGATTSTIITENEKGLLYNNLSNRMRMMVDTGSKGSKINLNQMASLFGTVALDGKRMPMSLTGKTLPSFKPYDADPRAGGYIPTRFVTGIDPKSYYFLCIVGRDSLQHTAVKTANSGYMQRCLIKHLEGIHVNYDMTVRNSDGVVLQFQYGEDGLDVSKVPFLKDVNTIDSFIDTYRRCLSKKDLKIAMKARPAALDKEKIRVNRYAKKGKKEVRTGGFLRFCKEQMHMDPSVDYTKSHGKCSLISSWFYLTQEENRCYNLPDEKKKRRQDPLLSRFSGVSSFGVVSEALDSLIDCYHEEKYMRRRPEERFLSKDQLVNTLYMKAFRSIAEPGEAVGALCAQAIGEPLTQMTLNTFHFAGRDELNVTLGVPRMIEILRHASSNIKTPIMEVPFKLGITATIAERLRIRLTPVYFNKVINRVNISSSLQQVGAKLCRRTEICFYLLPHRNYKKLYYIRPAHVFSYIENKFIKRIISEVKSACKCAKSAGVKFKTGLKLRKKEHKDDDEDMDGRNENESSILPVPENKEEVSCSEEELEGNQDVEEGIAYSGRTMKMKEFDYSEDEGEDQEGIEMIDEAKREANVPSLDNLDTGDDELENSGMKEDLKARTMSLNKDHEHARKKRVMAQDPWVFKYDYDEEALWSKITLDLPIADGQYDLVSILHKIVPTSLLYHFGAIRKAFVVSDGPQFLLRSEGVNLRGMYAFEDILDINNIYTNDIQMMSSVYGIEAAQRCIIREIREVQSAYDIKVDFRHLSLLADYFTCEGVYKACSRHAMSSCSSLLQLMSYETCLKFLGNGLVQGLKDNMKSPSANVMVGQPIKVGTNCIQILSKLALT